MFTPFIHTRHGGACNEMITHGSREKENEICDVIIAEEESDQKKKKNMKSVLASAVERKTTFPMDWYSRIIIAVLMNVG